MTFDKAAWERTQNIAYREASRRALAVPAVAEAVDLRTPIVLTCPWGHPLRTVELRTDSEHPEAIEVWAIAERGRKSGAVAREDSPFTGWKVCDESGCGTLIEYAGWCEKHGGRERVEVHDVRTRFTCRRHKSDWSDSVLTPRLIQVITTALAVGHTTVPVIGRVAVRTRRTAR